MGVFCVGVEVAEAWDDEPFVEGSASIGGVVVSQDECKAKSRADKEVLKASEEGSGVLCCIRRGCSSRYS